MRNWLPTFAIRGTTRPALAERLAGARRETGSSHGGRRGSDEAADQRRHADARLAGQEEVLAAGQLRLSKLVGEDEPVGFLWRTSYVAASTFDDASQPTSKDGPVYRDRVTAEGQSIRIATLTIPDGSIAYLGHPRHGYIGIAAGGYEAGDSGRRRRPFEWLSTSATFGATPQRMRRAIRSFRYVLDQ